MKEKFAVIRLDNCKNIFTDYKVEKIFTDYDVACEYVEKLKEEEPDSKFGVMWKEPIVITI